MGNAFMSGGAAGFGKGGPYAAWGWGWYTMIYADGSVYTNRLRAEGGYVRNMTIGNCTIDQDCVVNGTVYANRIVGDVCKVVSTSSINTEVTIEAFNRVRRLVVTAPTCFGIVPNAAGSSQTRRVRMRVFVNGSQVAINETNFTISVSPTEIQISGYNSELELPAGQAARVKFIVDVQSVGNYYEWGFTVVRPTPMIAMAFMQ